MVAIGEQKANHKLRLEWQPGYLAVCMRGLEVTLSIILCDITPLLWYSCFHFLFQAYIPTDPKVVRYSQLSWCGLKNKLNEFMGLYYSFYMGMQNGSNLGVWPEGILTHALELRCNVARYVRAWPCAHINVTTITRLTQNCTMNIALHCVVCSTAAMFKGHIHSLAVVYTEKQAFQSRQG